MSEQVSARATVEMALAEPIPFVWAATRKVSLGIYVAFEHTYHGPDRFLHPGFDHTNATLFADDGCNSPISIRYDGEWSPPLPDWCPEPPEGWDANVEALRESLSGTVAK